MKRHNLIIFFVFASLYSLAPAPSINALGAEPTESEEALTRKAFETRRDSRLSVGARGRSLCSQYARKDGQSVCENLKNCGTDAIAKIEEKLKNLSNPAVDAKPTSDADSATRMRQRFELIIQKAEVYAFQRETLADAIRSFEEASKLARRFDPELALNALGRKGIAQLRLAEFQNCVNHHHRRSCIYPIVKEAQHVEKKWSEEAKSTFLSYLKEKPEDPHIRWLLNITQMTLGNHPEGLPKEYQISHDRLLSPVEFPRFENIADELGVSPLMHVGGAVADDFNGDGYLDLMFGSLGPCSNMKYYEFDPKLRKFMEKTSAGGFDGQRGVGLILQADYDNDGDLDVFLTRGSWHPGGRESPIWGGFVFNSLMRNEGEGHFTEVTESVGLKGDPNSTLSAAWGDINNDGFVDLYVSNESRESEIYLNQQGKKFVNHTKKSGVKNNLLSKGVVFTDINSDGNLDLVISNLQAPKKLYLGDGKGAFKPGSPATLAEPHHAFPLVAFDVENDGDQDVFIGSFKPNIDHFVDWLLGKPNEGDSGRFFRNDDKGSLKDSTKIFGLDRVSIVMSLNAGDLNSDGFPELYLGTGSNSIGDLEPNRLFLNRQGKGFDEVTIQAGLGTLQKGHGISFADLNRDGYNEVVLQQGGFPGSDVYFPAIFRNPGFPSNKWVNLKLEGKKSNRIGLHSKIKVTTLSAGVRNVFYHWAGNTGSFGSNPTEALIGLGPAEKIDRIEIFWHGSGTHQVLNNVPLNSHFLVREGDPELRRRIVESFELSIPVSASGPSMHKHH